MYNLLVGVNNIFFSNDELNKNAYYGKYFANKQIKRCQHKMLEIYYKFSSVIQLLHISI